MGMVKVFNPYKWRLNRMVRILLKSMMQVGGHYTRFQNYAVNWLSKYYQNQYKLFTSIEIETINRCNNTCSFCPVNANKDMRQFARMDESLFRKIIDELAELKYPYRIALYSNNEPYMDKLIISRIEYVRKKCPNVLIQIITNGLLLNMEKLLQSIDAGLNKIKITINNYNDTLELNENIKEIVKEIEKPQYEYYLDKFEIHLRKKTEVLTNRGGKAPNKNITDYTQYLSCRDIGCTLPFRQMVVRSSGEISLCCNDALGEVTLGNVKEQELMKIWNGPAYRRLREDLLKNGRKNLKICNVCDVTDSMYVMAIYVILIIIQRLKH